MAENRANPYCCVNRCRTDKPHTDDPIVSGLIRQFTPPEQLTSWTLAAMAELRNSICRDLGERQVFAWFSRLRQPEELYIRTLYILFVATDAEIPHIFSGAMPNGFSFLYSKVNDVVFEGNGQLLLDQPGLNSGTFKPIDTLHDGAHTSIRAFLTCFSLVNSPEKLPSVEKYSGHLTKYCDYLNYMHDMFKAGKEKQHVLAGLRNMHRPPKHWEAAQAEIRERGKE